MHSVLDDMWAIYIYHDYIQEKQESIVQIAYVNISESQP